MADGDAVCWSDASGTVVGEDSDGGTVEDGEVVSPVSPITEVVAGCPEGA